MLRMTMRAAGAPARAAQEPRARRPALSVLCLSALLWTLAACGGERADADHAEAGHADDHAAEEHAHDDHGEHEGESHEGEDHEHEDHSDLVRLSDAALHSAGIVVAEAERGPMPQTLSLPAEIRFDPDRLARISAPVGGIVRALPASEGDHVAAGAPLAVISSRDLASLKSDYLAAEAAETLARTQAARAQELLEADAVSQSEYQTARADYDRAVAARSAAETELHALGLGHDVIDSLREADDGEHALYTLTAPIAGRVIQRALTLGEAIEPEEGVGAPVFIVADTSVVWADIAVFKADLGRVSEGDAVTLVDDAGRTLAGGAISFVSPVIDADSRTGTARVVIDNPDRALRPGQFVTARIESGAGEAALRVPADAVQTVEGGPAVFVPEDDGFAPRPVATGRQAGGHVEIVSGLTEGERFVSAGAFTLKAELEKDSFGDGHVH